MGAESSQIVLLAVAYVDIVGLKVENDKYGQAAGDALLQPGVRATRTHVRSYDMIVRGRRRVPGRDVRRAPALRCRRPRARGRPRSVRDQGGFAALTPQDGELIERADSDLPQPAAG